MDIVGGSDWVMTILLGAVAGAIGKLLMPGRDPGGFVITILLGIAGALLMTMLGWAFGFYAPNDAVHLLAAIIGSVLLLFIYRVIHHRRGGPPRL